MSDGLWTPLGTEAETYVLLDPCGTPGGRWWAQRGSRDLARFAMMLLNHGTVDGTRVVPAAVIDTLEAREVAAFQRPGGDRADGRR